jgi:hypothetical protein
VPMGLTALVLGCADPLPAVDWEGEHVIFAPEHPEQVCAGTREFLDRRAGQILERLGSDPIKIEYYLLDDVSEHCKDPAAAGCVVSGAVYTEHVPHFHEIVHARTSDLMPRVLEEGFAEYFGADLYPISKMVSRERLVELLTQDIGEINTPGEYARATHFMAFLAETYGWERLLDLDGLLVYTSSTAEVDGAFQTVFGGGIADMLDEYEDYPDCTGHVDMSLACEGEAIQLDIFQQRFERRVDCAASDAIGPHVGRAFVEDILELGPTLDGNGRILSASGDGFDKGGLMVVRPCGPCPEAPVGIMRRGVAFVAEEDIPAGRYVVRTYLPLGVGPGEFVLGVGG